MQAGFAMVETGFTRAKNAGNIIMKNLMDFCLGTVVFIFEELKQALNAIGVTGLTVTQVLGCGVQKGASEYYRGVKVDMDVLPKVKVEVVVSKVPVSEVISAARKALYTGHIGDGKIFVYDVENAVRVRTGETGYDALQDSEERVKKRPHALAKDKEGPPPAVRRRGLLRFFAAPVRRSVPPSFRGRRALPRRGSPRRRRLPGRRG